MPGCVMGGNLYTGTGILLIACGDRVSADTLSQIGIALQIDPPACISVPIRRLHTN